MRINTVRQKQNTAARLEQLVELPQHDSFSDQNRKVKIGKFKNLTAAMARYIAQDGRSTAIVTLTFGTKSRLDFGKMSDRKLIVVAETQYNSLMAFLHKMRKSKMFKSDIRYFAVVELQSDGNLHTHISVSVTLRDQCALIEFLHDFKKRHNSPYTFNKKSVLPIGRSHVGLSSMYREKLESQYRLIKKPSKSDPRRTELFMPSLESRNFASGDWTALEFYTKSMMEDRYHEQILKYLEKTIDGSYLLTSTDIKEGAAKCLLSHDTKTVFSDAYITRLQVAFIRLVGSRLYTHSRLPFPSSLYQRHRKALIAYKVDYKVYYKCIEDLENGELIISKNNIHTSDGYLITNNKNK